jgi:hypothetical protein
MLCLFFVCICLLGRGEVCNAQQSTCLERLKASGAIHAVQPSDEKLDRLNVGNASFSCDLYVQASAAKDALEDFRAGLPKADKALMDKVLLYPVRVIIDDPATGQTKQTLTVKNYSDWATVQSKDLTKEQLKLVDCSELGNVTIVGRGSFNPGFIIGDGLVFFSTKNPKHIGVASIHLMQITPEMLNRACTQ